MLFGALQQGGPAERGREQFHRPRPHVGCELSASEEQTELILRCKFSRHDSSEMTKRFLNPSPCLAKLLVAEKSKELHVLFRALPWTQVLSDG